MSSLPTWAFRKGERVFEGPAAPGDYEKQMDREQSIVFLAYPDAGIREDAYLTGELVDEICSDMSGRLFGRVREEKSLAYFVGSSRITAPDYGMFYFFAGTRPDAAETVLDELNAEAERLRLGELTRGEIERCRTRLKTEKRAAQQSMGRRAMQACLEALYGLPENHWKTYDERIGRVTAEDVQRFAVDYFSENDRVSLIVHP